MQAKEAWLETKLTPPPDYLLVDGLNLPEVDIVGEAIPKGEAIPVTEVILLRQPLLSPKSLETDSWLNWIRSTPTTDSRGIKGIRHPNIDKRLPSLVPRIFIVAPLNSFRMLKPFTELQYRTLDFQSDI